MQDKYKGKIVNEQVRVCPEIVFGNGDKALHVARFEADCLDTLIIEQTDVTLPVGTKTTEDNNRVCLLRGVTVFELNIK